MNKYNNESPRNKNLTKRTRKSSEENVKNNSSGDEDSKNSEDEDKFTDDLDMEEDLSNSSINSSSNRLKSDYQNESKKSPESPAKQSHAVFLYGIVGLFVFSLFSFGQYIGHTDEMTLEMIQNNFPSQPKETLETIEAIIDDVLKIEPIHPAVFLFLFDEKTENDNFIAAVANFASFKLGVDKTHVVLDESVYLKSSAQKDYGYLIAKYKPILDVRKVMIIKNLHKMPGTTAQALQSFCDEITPLVDRAVYIMTLKVDKFNKNEIHTAERKLYEIWNDLKTDILAPLVTRVTSTVIKIY